MATISEALAAAIQRHQTGQLDAAEHLYRQILQADPNHAEALHLLGLIAHHVGKHDAAIDCITNAIRLKPDVAEFHHHLGKVFHALRRFPESAASYRRGLELEPSLAEAHRDLGNLFVEQSMFDQAVACYRWALDLNPNLTGVYNNLGVALKTLGQLDEALTAQRRALELNPTLAAAHSNLGVTFRDLGRAEEAIACFRRALDLNPHFTDALRNLGAVLKEQHRLEEAIACCRRLAELQPHSAQARSVLGLALAEHGNLDEAIACHRQAVTLSPDLAEAHGNLGLALLEQGRLEPAAASFRRALELKPDLAEAYNNLGSTLKSQGKWNDAVACFRRAVELKPGLAEAHNNLGLASKDHGQLDEAIRCFRTAIALKPEYAAAHNNLGTAFAAQGNQAEAAVSFRRALELKPAFAEAHSNLIYALLFSPGCDPQGLLEEHRHWRQRHAAPLAPSIRPHLNDRSPNRRLRIGYVSPNFRDHVVGLNLLPLFREHDHARFSLFCYSDALRPDALTARFRGYADAWCDSAGLTDAQLAERIREDRIDILVDLTLHMAKNRLLVFARRPAPVQVTFAGYPGTTGLSAIAYRLTDPCLDPPGLFDHCYTEESIRLPDSFWCYEPLDGELPVNALPAAEKGCLTFGCLNNFCKANPSMIHVWARVLKSADRSRLMLLAGEGTHRRETLALLAGEGVDPSRVTFVPQQPRPAYLRCYHEIDIGLDTLPYNGHTTSLDSFWMGVPVITLVGSTVVGRAGLSQLMNLGLPELIAFSPEQYIKLATDLAHDLPRLGRLRATLRDRMHASPLMDAPRFARNIEAAYRQMWRGWCAD